MTVSLFSFSPPEKISIPTLNDHRPDFDYLFSLSKKYRDYSGHILFTFDHCSFIRHNAVAVLGGLVTYIKKNGGRVDLNIPSMKGNVHINLAQNGFLSFCGYDEPKWQGNAVSIQHFEETDRDAIIHYLNEEWLLRSWLSISPRLLDEIVGAVWEIFTNAFEHSDTQHGIFTCGQKYPILNELNLTWLILVLVSQQMFEDTLTKRGMILVVSPLIRHYNGHLRKGVLRRKGRETPVSVLIS